MLSVDYTGDLDDKLLANLRECRRELRADFAGRDFEDALRAYDWTLYQLGLRHGWPMDPPPEGARLSNDHRADLEEYLVGRGLDVRGDGDDA